MVKNPQRKEWVANGFDIAVVVNKSTEAVKGAGQVKRRHTYSKFHKMLASDWDPKKVSHFIPITTFDAAMESYKEHDGAGPCTKCFPGGKAGSTKVEDDGSNNAE